MCITLMTHHSKSNTLSVWSVSISINKFITTISSIVENFLVRLDTLKVIFLLKNSLKVFHFHQNLYIYIYIFIALDCGNYYCDGVNLGISDK